MLKRLSLAAVLALATAIPASAEPFHHSFGEWREYNRDWLGACPDHINESDTTSYYGTHCFASTGSQEQNDASYPVYKLTLFLDRLDGGLDIAFTYAPSSGPEIDETRPLRIRFGDDEALALSFSDDLETRYNTINQYFVADPAKRDALIEAMKERNAATLLVPVAGDTREVRLSMRGVIASLDFMSAYARRVENYD